MLSEIQAPLYQTDVVRIQNRVRGYLERKKFYVIQNEKDNLALTEFARKYLLDPQMLTTVPHPPRGRNRSKIYIPSDVPVVIKACQETKDFQRFFNMQKAKTIRRSNRLLSLCVPKAHLLDVGTSSFILEEKLPNGNANSLAGMVFYYENRDFYKKAVLDFANFLSFGHLKDIVGNNKSWLESLIKGAHVPRFDNLLLYFTECNGQKLYKIGIIDLEEFEVYKSEPSRNQIFIALKRTLQIFPYHYVDLLNTWADRIDQKMVNELHKICENSTLLYESVCAKPLAFYDKHRISEKNQIFVPLTPVRQIDIIDKIIDFLCIVENKCRIFQNNLNKLELLRKAILPDLISFAEKILRNNFNKCISESSEILNKGELIQSRIFTGKITEFMSDHYLKEMDKKTLGTIQLIFRSTKPETFFKIFCLIFREFLIKLSGEEIAFYNLIDFGNWEAGDYIIF